MDDLFWNHLKTRHIGHGNCLNHCKVILDLGEIANQEKVSLPFVVAQGDVFNDEGRPILHCWLETTGVDSAIVVDLIRPEKRFPKEDYYTRARVDRQSVRTFDLLTTAGNMLKHGLTFWGREI